METPAEFVKKLGSSVTKQQIRQKVWDYLEAKNIANFPRPVHNRIPNFKGAATASDKVASMEVFKKAQTVKVNPDKPQEVVRFHTLEAHKTLLVPTPRLRTGLFNRITPPSQSKETFRKCATSQGVKEHSLPLSLDTKVKIDLIVIGAVAVSKTGLRIGKGEGFADLEYAMMVNMGAVDDNTVVVCSVHDCQVMDIPAELYNDHDLTVDYVVTPTQIIKCEGGTHSKPKRLIWSRLTPKKFREIPILKHFRQIDEKKGLDVRFSET